MIKDFQMARDPELSKRIYMQKRKKADGQSQRRRCGDRSRGQSDVIDGLKVREGTMS